MLRIFLVSFLGMVFFGAAQAQTVPGDQADENGIVTCKAKIESTAKFIVKDSGHTSNSTWNSKNPDGRLFNSQVAIDKSDVAVINVAPTKSGNCDASYTRIFYVSKSCISLRETTLKSWKFVSEHAGVTYVTTEKGDIDGMIMPADSGCIFIKTEVTY